MGLVLSEFHVASAGSVTATRRKFEGDAIRNFDLTVVPMDVDGIE
jgi:hypothetical protein